jgi:hypothetical protein
MRKKTIATILVGVMLLSTTVVMAKSQAKDIQVYDSESTIYVDGSVASFDSAPFVYNGTTYLPIRDVSKALGEEISYSTTAKAIYIGMQPGVPQYMTELVKPVNQLFGEVYHLDYKEKLEMYGRDYNTAIAINRGGGSMEFNLDGKYSKITADLGIRGSVSEEAAVQVIIYRDSEEYFAYKLYGNANEAREIEIPVKGVKVLKIQLDDWRKGSGSVALGNPMIEWDTTK